MWQEEYKNMSRVNIEATDQPANSRTDINNNFIELYTGKNINDATEKATPVDADKFGILDSAASNVMKYLTFANLKTILKTYFDSVTTTLTNKTLTSPTINTPTIDTPVINGAFTGTTTPPLTFYGANFLPPRGYMINGKFTVTDTGSGITVALKGKNGSDPSASNPVYIMIGDTLRSVTSALSVTLADGTNWMNMGGSELATKEVDLFLYAVWNVSDSAVKLGFSRIPSANLVSDFSATNNDEKYIAGYSGFSTTDEVEVIGRFAATLSSGASYTWSTPSPTATNLIQKPIYETRWNSAKSVLSGFSSITSETLAYKIIDSALLIESIGILGGTSNATTFTMTLPFKAGSIVGTKNLMSSNCGDAGSTLSAPSFLGIISGSASVTVGKTMANTSGGGFTASSTKWVTLSGLVIQI